MQDVDFHPTGSLLATGVINGRLLIHSCTKDKVSELHTIKAHDHEHPCRAVRFSLSGELLLSSSTDRSILAVDVATGRAQARKKDAHDDPISRLAAVSETMTASGDEKGVIKLWDSRQSDAVASLSPHSDFVSDMSLATARHDALLSTSGDGTLALTDLRSNKIKYTSEGDADDELLSVAVVKNGRKVVCGTTSGVLNIWSWGYWQDCSDRFPGHPDSVTSIVKFDEDTILTASSDGLIRVLSIQPNKMLGVLGAHSNFDIERLAATADRSLLASASHDNSVKIWTLGELVDDDEEEEEEEKEEEKVPIGADASESDREDFGKPQRKRHKGRHKIPKRREHEKDGSFFADLL